MPRLVTALPRSSEIRLFDGDGSSDGPGIMWKGGRGVRTRMPQTMKKLKIYEACRPPRYPGDLYGIFEKFRMAARLDFIGVFAWSCRRSSALPRRMEAVKESPNVSQRVRNGRQDARAPAQVVGAAAAEALRAAAGGGEENALEHSRLRRRYYNFTSL